VCEYHWPRELGRGHIPSRAVRGKVIVTAHSAGEQVLAITMIVRYDRYGIRDNSTSLFRGGHGKKR
jgi:hypothetical protein